jgi:hypothetical protein
LRPLRKPAALSRQPHSMIDALVERALKALRQLTANGPLTVFIDPTLHDPTTDDPDFRDQLDRLTTAGGASRQSLPRVHDNFDTARQPFVLRIAGGDGSERLINTSVRLAVAEALDAYADARGRRSICGWAAQNEGVQVPSVTSLAEESRLLKPDGSPGYLRWWDPRVLWLLPQRLPPARWAALRSSLGTWAYLDPLRQLTVVPTATSAEPPADVSRTRGSPWQVDPATWAGLQRIGPTNQVLAMCWDWGLIPSAALADTIDSLLVRCAERGFHSEQDSLVFAACGLTSHPRFDTHSEVSAKLDEAAAQSNSVQSALSRFDDDFWSKLSSVSWAQPDLNSKMPQRSSPI